MHSSCLCSRLGRLVTARVGVVCTGVDIPPSTPPDKTLGCPSAACMVGEAFVFPNTSALSATVSTYTLSLHETKNVVQLPVQLVRPSVDLYPTAVQIKQGYDVL
ncbi:hypothetical protein B0H14DRAFT_3431155 [Mycena olivaceomarginata]|nr:hypothetical protein B0H14DRAFT_3431155 [Mycena olivaceomarginata]